MDWLLGISLAVGAYLLGSVPPSYILVHLVRGVDIRKVGTGNVGALNTYHQAGIWAALVVLLIDAGKGVVAVFAPGWVGLPGWTVFLTTSLVVAGHNWPVFLGFRGGKGAAAILGVSWALVPALTAVALGPTALVALLTRNVVLGAAAGFLVLNTLLVVTDQGIQQIALCLFLTAVVTITYLAGAWDHIASSIRSRRWKELFTGLA